MRKGEVVIGLGEQTQRYFTGLQVASDPGVWVVYSGFILMILGCYITFFMSHQQICVELTASGKQTEVIVAGTANKNKTAMATRIEAAADKLAKSNPVA
jgi:cytochrome c biogenesis protein